MIRHTLFAAALALSLSSNAQAQPPAEWQFKPWDAAVAQAKAEKKPLFVMFGYADCEWCDQLYRRAMSDKSLRALYQSKAVLTYVDTKSHAKDDPYVMPDGTRTTHEALIKRYRAYPTPSWVFLSGTGEVLQADRGGKSTSGEMKRDLEAALSKQ